VPDKPLVKVACGQTKQGLVFAEGEVLGVSVSGFVRVKISVNGKFMSASYSPSRVEPLNDAARTMLPKRRSADGAKKR